MKLPRKIFIAFISSFVLASTSAIAADDASNSCSASKGIQSVSEDQQKGAPANETKVVLKVTGMTCGSCVNGLKTALTGVEGVTGADVDFKAGTATVTCETGKVKPSTLADVVEKAGYQVAIVQ